MLGRLLLVDRDMASRFALKHRLTAAHYEVQAIAAMPDPGCDAGEFDAVLLMGCDRAELTGMLDQLRHRRSAAPVIAICDESLTDVALAAGADYALDARCTDMVLRARLRSWLSVPVGVWSQMSACDEAFEQPHRIVLVSGDAARAAEWSVAVLQATGLRVEVFSPADDFSGLTDGLALIMIDAAAGSAALQYLADLRAWLSAHCQGAALAILQRQPDPDQEAVALDIGATDVLSPGLSAPDRAGILAARLGWLTARGIEAARRQSRDRLARQLATADALTGLMNRRGIAAEIAAAAEAHDRYALLMIDIDRFKDINDGWGHLAGDAVIRNVARTLARVVGPCGRVARYGGEEFTVLLNGADETDAISLAELIRGEVAALVTRTTGPRGAVNLRVSVSVGVAVSDAATRAWRSGQDMICTADSALLAAKSAGRNLVMISRQLCVA